MGPSHSRHSQSGIHPVPYKDVPGQTISPYKAKECTAPQPAAASNAAQDVWGKGRNDRNYDKAALFRENGLNIQRWLPAGERELWADAEQVENSCASAARLWISLNRQLAWASPGPRAHREHLNHVVRATSVLGSVVIFEQRWLLRHLNA